MISIYNRYVLKEWVKIFSLFIFSIYLLYGLIDYSVNFHNFQNFHIKTVFSYYFFEFLKQAELMIPFGSLLATIKVLTSFNIRNELVALTSSGVSYKKLLSPFLYCALCCSCILCLNYELFYPHAASVAKGMKKHFNKHSFRVHHLVLPDETTLVYQSYDPKNKVLEDVFWIINADNIYHMKQLFVLQRQARFVDHLARDKQGAIKKIESFASYRFTNLKFDEKKLLQEIQPPEWQSLTELSATAGSTLFTLKKISERESGKISHLLYKVTLPLLPVLALIAVAPFCLQYRRNTPVFLIFGYSLFGLIAFLTIVNASLIFGENQVIPPIVALTTPYIMSFTIFGIRYAKL